MKLVRMIHVLVILTVKSLLVLSLMVGNSFICGFFVVMFVAIDIVINKSLFCRQDVKIKHTN